MADPLKPDLEALERLCPEAAELIDLEKKRSAALEKHRNRPIGSEDMSAIHESYQYSHRIEEVVRDGIEAIAACIVELARHLREAYCSLYGVEDGNKLFEGLINGMNMDNRKERG